MDRELDLLVFALCSLGATPALGAVIPALVRPRASGRAMEREAWFRLWAPLIPSLVAFAALAGWVAREPADAERLPLWLILAAACVGAALLRALARTAIAALAEPAQAPAQTVGLLRPRVVIADRFARVLDASAARAARAHEAAHARHRDPLRLLLAQLATDLQAPWGPPRRRFLAWRHALEIARDEEARALGTSGEDLAAAIVDAARVSQQSAMSRSASVCLVDGSSALTDRIVRLLGPLPSAPREPPRRVWVAAVVLMVAVAALAGAIGGEHVVHALFGAAR